MELASVHGKELLAGEVPGVRCAPRPAAQRWVRAVGGVPAPRAASDAVSPTSAPTCPWKGLGWGPAGHRAGRGGRGGRGEGPAGWRVTSRFVVRTWRASAHRRGPTLAAAHVIVHHARVRRGSRDQARSWPGHAGHRRPVRHRLGGASGAARRDNLRSRCLPRSGPTEEERRHGRRVESPPTFWRSGCGGPSAAWGGLGRRLRDGQVL